MNLNIDHIVTISDDSLEIEIQRAEEYVAQLRQEDRRRCQVRLFKVETKIAVLFQDRFGRPEPDSDSQYTTPDSAPPSPVPGIAKQPLIKQKAVDKVPKPTSLPRSQRRRTKLVDKAGTQICVGDKVNILTPSKKGDLKNERFAIVVGGNNESGRVNIRKIDDEGKYTHRVCCNLKVVLD